jgi:hypothetical protein
MNMEFARGVEDDSATFKGIVEDLQDVSASAEKIIGDILLRQPLIPHGGERDFSDSPMKICGSDSYSEVDEQEGGHDPPQEDIYL